MSCLEITGADGRIRTGDLLITNYQPGFSTLVHGSANPFRINPTLNLPGCPLAYRTRLAGHLYASFCDVTSTLLPQSVLSFAPFELDPFLSRQTVKRQLDQRRSVQAGLLLKSFYQARVSGPELDVKIYFLRHKSMLLADLWCSRGAIVGGPWSNHGAPLRRSAICLMSAGGVKLQRLQPNRFIHTRKGPHLDMCSPQVVRPAFFMAALALGYFESYSPQKNWRKTETAHLSSEIDQELVQRLYELRLSRQRGLYKPGDAWRCLGGLRGLPHVISQGRLLTNLVSGLHAQYPELFTYEVNQVRGARFCLLLGSLGAIREAIRARRHPNYQRHCTIFLAEALCDLAAEVRCALEVYGSLG